jgi:hypothetical protein
MIYLTPFGRAATCLILDADKICRAGVGEERLPGWINVPQVSAKPGQIDQVLMLDIIEHLKERERFADELRCAAAGKPQEVIITTANIGFAVTRLMLLFEQFNYGKKGILDATNTRLLLIKT